jgi:release factor glutamine methyltransferase
VTVTVAELLRAAAGRLAAAGLESPRADAEVLLAHVLGWARTRLWAWPDHPASAPARERFFDLVERRARGEPVAYLTGRRAFWTVDLEVGPDVLIPRPETELLVEQALAAIPDTEAIAAADLGTGSGAVALAIALERPGWRVVATDASAGALAIARRNADRLGAGNVELREGDWATALGKEQFALIVSNPPYVADGDRHLLEGDLPWEPRSALVAGPDGLGAIRALLPGTAARLVVGGWLMLEHGPDQGGAVRALLAAAGLGDVRTIRDLEGRERVTVGRRKPAAA